MRDFLKNPARLVPLVFAAVILVGTLALMLPFARPDGVGAPFLTALFVATSATAVTGLSTVDTAVYWSGFGQGVIYLLFHIGGFGIMSAATLLGMVVSRKIGLGRQLIVQAEARGIAAGDVKSVLAFVFLVAAMVEVIVAAVITSQLLQAGLPASEALWHGIFLAGASFTNAGFMSLPGGSAIVADHRLSMAVMMGAIVIGGLGLPVLHELRQWEKGRWSLHARMTLWGTAVLFVLGAVVTLVFEWDNAATLGGKSWFDAVLQSMFHSVNTRSGGLNVFDTGAIQEETMLASYALMVVGAGSAGMGGGIKVSTLMIILLAVWSEMRGDAETQAFGRRLSPAVLREALVLVALSVGVLMVAVLALRLTSHLPLNPLIFEAISAFANVGLSMGLTHQLQPSAQWIIILLMYLGRVGIITVATGLALRARRTEYRYPEERPIVG
jgi:trk system potassium uptake protein TrkH